MAEKKIVIIGAGISGLSAAYYLEQTGENNITILEQSAVAGGKIKSLHEDGFLVEAGPDAFVSTKPEIMQLVKQLGIDSELIQPKQSQFFIYTQKKLKPVPAGLASLYPSDFKAFLISDIVSWKAKLRMAVERFIPAKNNNEDESMAEFIERRFGSELLNNIAEPLFSGVYSTPARELSLNASFPQFKMMEQKYGSITKAILANRKNMKGGAGSIFRSFRGGMSTLVNGVINNLKNTSVKYNIKVNDLIRKGNNWIINTSDGEISADKIIITVPANIASGMVKNISEELSVRLSEIEFTSSIILTMAFHKSAIKNKLKATGFLVPAEEQNFIAACTFASEKWENRAPADYLLYRCFVNNKVLSMDEEEILKSVISELDIITGVNNKPEKYWFQRWNNAQPLYKVGHLERIAAIEKTAATLAEGLFFTGASYRGVGIPDLVRQAKETAGKL